MTFMYPSMTLASRSNVVPWPSASMKYESPPAFVKSTTAMVSLKAGSFGISVPFVNATFVTRFTAAFPVHVHVIGPLAGTSLPAQPVGRVLSKVNLKPEICGKRPAQLPLTGMDVGHWLTPFSSADQSWLPVTDRVRMLLPNVITEYTSPAVMS